MSKITNNGLIQFGTGWMLYSCTHMATVGIKVLTSKHVQRNTMSCKLTMQVSESLACTASASGRIWATRVNCYGEPKTCC